MSDVCNVSIRYGCTAGCIVQWKDFTSLRFLRLLNQVCDSVTLAINKHTTIQKFGVSKIFFYTFINQGRPKGTLK